MQERANGAGKTRFIALAAGLVLIAGIAGWFAERLLSDPAGALSSSDRRAIETIVRDYILANPEIIPEAMENLHQRENAKQLASIRDDVEAPFPGAVLGNPNGSVTLVEFTDFACGYCRKSVDDIAELIKRHPQLRVVVRELPILSPHSVDAARMALAAAEQGKYAAFHDAMFAAGQPGPETIEAAALQAGLDLAKARKAGESPRIQKELDDNLAMARQLGFNGTPSWVVGDQLISGAVGVDRLAEAIEAAEQG